MKLFNLISGKSVHINPETKVIPKNEFSKLQEAKDLLETIHQEGVDYRARIAKEGEDLFEKSKHEGFEEGLKSWATQIKLLEDEKSKIRGEIEKVIAKVALVTTKKIIGRELKQDPTTLIDIVAKNLKSVTSHRKITIFVNKVDLSTFNENKESLKNVFEDIDTFAIQPRDDITEGGAIIETEAGIIDARVESMWKTIEKTFEELFKKK